MNFESLIQNLQVNHNTLNESAAKAVNTAMTVRNWLYGFYIVEYEQNGEDRATYGDRLIRTFEKQLKDMGQKGMSFTNLNLYRQFYLTYPHIGYALPPFLSSLGIIQAMPEQLQEKTNDQIIQTVSEQSPENTKDSIIQAVPEQSPDSVKDTIGQAVPEQFKPFDIKAIQVLGETKSAEAKPGLNPARLLQT